MSGIEYISRLNIVHRDLKPENLLLDFDKGIKIVDFGLSNTYKTGELLKTACGSPCYAAPEMIAGKKYNGTNVDIWSCGVILFALICGYLPFEDPNTSNLYKKILSADFQTPEWVSEDAKDLFHCILRGLLCPSSSASAFAAVGPYPDMVGGYPDVSGDFHDMSGGHLDVLGKN